MNKILNNYINTKSILELEDVLSYMSIIFNSPSMINSIISDEKYNDFRFNIWSKEYDVFQKLCHIYINVLKEYSRQSKYRIIYKYKKMNKKFDLIYENFGFRRTRSGKNKLFVISSNIYKYPFVKSVVSRGEKYSNTCIYRRIDLTTIIFLPTSWEKTVYENDLHRINNKLILYAKNKGKYYEMIWCSQSKGLSIATYKSDVYRLKNGKFIFKNTYKINPDCLLLNFDNFINGQARNCSDNNSDLYTDKFIDSKIRKIITDPPYSISELSKFFNNFSCFMCRGSHRQDTVNEKNIDFCLDRNKLSLCKKFNLLENTFTSTLFKNINIVNNTFNTGITI